MLFTAPELPGKQQQDESVCEPADRALISRALLLVCRPCCKSRAVQIGREDLPGGHREVGLQTASLLHHVHISAALPTSTGMEGQGSAHIPCRDPEGSSRVLKASGWDCKAAEAAGPQPEDRSRLFGAVTWSCCPGTDPCAELSTFSSPQRKKMVLSP